MQTLIHHAMTQLIPRLLGEDALLNGTIAEVERMALEEAERLSPRYARGEEMRREGYAKYRLLRGSTTPSGGVVYGLEWIVLRLPVLCRRDEDWNISSLDKLKSTEILQFGKFNSICMLYFSKILS